MAQTNTFQSFICDSTFKSLITSYKQFRLKIDKSLSESTDGILFWNQELEIFRKKLVAQKLEKEQFFYTSIFLRDRKTKRNPKSKECKDYIQISFNNDTKIFELIIADNSFVPEFGCSEKNFIYRFVILSNKINIVEVLGAG